MFRTSLVGLETSLMKKIEFENSTHDLQIGMELSSSAVESKYLVTDTLQNGNILEDNRKSMAPSDVSELGIYFLDAITLGEEQDWVLSPSLDLISTKLPKRIKFYGKFCKCWLYTS